MKKRFLFALLASHLVVAALGFAAGVYVLPILVAPAAPDQATLDMAARQSRFVGRFSRDREGSDAFHWGDGEISLGTDVITFAGKLAPGPDYKLYLSPEFVETAADFERLKSRMVRVGDVRTFDNFIVPLRSDIDPADYAAAIVWCESFGQYITSAAYEQRPR